MKNCALIFVFVLALSVSSWPSTSADNYEILRNLVRKALTALEKVDELIETRRNSSQVIGRIVGKGYDFFSQSSTMSKIANLDRNFFDRFVELQVGRFGVPPKDKDEIKEKVFGKLKDNTEPGKWVEHKMLFNPANDPENTKYIAIYGFVRENRNFDIVILEVKASFTLAKNLLIIQNKLTGKISLEEEKLESERVPDGVDKNDIQVVLKFFEATALRILSSKI